MLMKKMIALVVTMVTGVAACGSAAADQTWLCSVASAVAVDEDGTVGPPDLGNRDRPTFFRVDAGKKELTILAPESRRGEVTKLDTVHHADGLHVFSGIEHGRGLNVVVTTEGRMTLSIVADGVVWSVFGLALPEDATQARSAAAPTSASATTAQSP